MGTDDDTVEIMFLRHAKAGDRAAWKRDDRLRPLTSAGQRQAFALVERWGTMPISQLLSSPYVRCVQTVEPLSEAIGIPIETSETLAEGRSLQSTLTLLATFEPGLIVLCSHGDIIGELIWHLAQTGLVHDELAVKKGSTWALRVAAGEVVSARYFPPPRIDDANFPA